MRLLSVLECLRFIVADVGGVGPLLVLLALVALVGMPNSILSVRLWRLCEADMRLVCVGEGITTLIPERDIDRRWACFCAASGWPVIDMRFEGEAGTVSEPAIREARLDELERLETEPPCLACRALYDLS